MKWTGLAAALLFAAAPIAAAQQSPTAAPAANGKITLQGCVRPAVDKDQVLVTDVTEVVGAGQSAIPTEAHGRKVIFWLDRDEALKPHVGHMVEVTGTQGKIENSEIELKAGRQKDGGLVVEFEGPGKDVKASNAVVGQPLGTSGRVTPEKNDVKTFLIHVKVDSVRPLTTNCG
jgi:hypothetical protein